MYWEDGNKKYGVLIDFDFSLPASRQRMGTMSYMAIDLLRPIAMKYLYRHDLESLSYVLFVLVTRYGGGKEIKNPPLQDWFELSPKLLRKEKVSFLRELPEQPISAFENIYPLLKRMAKMFYTGYAARTSHNMSAWDAQEDQAILDSEFDDDTLGGNVNFDKFQTLLNSIKPGSLS
jgi:hypothetical protein